MGKKEDKREYDKKWRKANKEKIREYNKKWRKANREKISESNKKYRENNLEKEKLRSKKYLETNREKINERKKKWRENNPETYHKTNTIGTWKYHGLISEDYESIYYLVMSTENCEGCNCKLTGNKPRTSTTRCMDHCHITGQFRAVLCVCCNLKQPRQKPIKL